ncbi:MAG: pyridoxal phosphate-dependent decarboxylase family protein [Streptosporangiaceae bacterium]
MPEAGEPAMMDAFALDSQTRDGLWQALGTAMEAYLADVAELDVAVPVDVSQVRELLAAFDFDVPLPATEALDLAVEGLRRFQPHVRHPRHFGLFDPAPATMGVVADALTAAINPCLASWESSPFGVEAERLIVSAFARRFGYGGAGADGIVTTGGSEAILSALMLALTARYPQHGERGVRGIPSRPLIYLTSEAHPSARKAARLTGLGAASVREVPVDDSLRMDLAALGRRIEADRYDGFTPLMIVVTAGTTGAGVIDPLAGAAEIARRHDAWLHVDAAWGGAAVLLEEMSAEFSGIERGDSLTLDPHKWMSIPMSCGLLLTRHGELLSRAFGTDVPFLPGDGAGGCQPPPASQDDAAPDPHTRSFRWSRSFAGLKLLLTLAVTGWRGYEEALRHQISLGDQLRDELRADGWTVVNHTPLPVVCFTDADADADVGVGVGADPRYLGLIARAVNASGEAKIFAARIGGRPVLRACVSSYATTAADIVALVKALGRARQDVRA